MSSRGRVLSRALGAVRLLRREGRDVYLFAAAEQRKVWVGCAGSTLVCRNGELDAESFFDALRRWAEGPFFCCIGLDFSPRESALPAAVALHNLYGPTEASVDVSFWECRRGEVHTSIPIGRPVANTQLYVLDPRMRPVPIGVPGELHIGGVQLALGYHGKPELTAQRFVADPFSPRAGARLFPRWSTGARPWPSPPGARPSPSRCAL